MQTGDIGVALQEPQKLVDDGLEMQLLGRGDRKPFERSKRIW